MASMSGPSLGFQEGPNGPYKWMAKGPLVVDKQDFRWIASPPPSMLPLRV